MSAAKQPLPEQSAVGEALDLLARELRQEAEHAAKASRDFGRGMAWAAVVVASRADDAYAGIWPGRAGDATSLTPQGVSSPEGAANAGTMDSAKAPCLQHEAPADPPARTTETGGLVPS